jgi:hypothetical protein
LRGKKTKLGTKTYTLERRHSTVDWKGEIQKEVVVDVLQEKMAWSRTFALNGAGNAFKTSWLAHIIKLALRAY